MVTLLNSSSGSSGISLILATFLLIGCCGFFWKLGQGVVGKVEHSVALCPGFLHRRQRLFLKHFSLSCGVNFSVQTVSTSMA